MNFRNRFAVKFKELEYEIKLNYDILGNHIRLIDTRNKDSITDRVLGINIDKFFMPSVANVIGIDLSKYKLITKGKFACNPMHVGRDERLQYRNLQKIHSFWQTGIMLSAFQMKLIVRRLTLI